jgi:hypothetical protein
MIIAEFAWWLLIKLEFWKKIVGDEAGVSKKGASAIYTVEEWRGGESWIIAAVVESW